MPKTVVLIGHCGADSSYLRIAVSSAAKNVVVATAYDDAELKKLIEKGVDLILFNRQLDYGFETEEGVELIARLRARHPDVPMMLVSNYAEAQQAAVHAGALPGFGKRELGSARVKQLLRSALGEQTSAAGKQSTSDVQVK